ncbi:AAA family ATPase [Streptomyces sp. bgisy022]|uniref:helix-turn-helix transcriptional regulator n=1 Tax=Streptomyces sp. bgisy022 TaxID=3413769 RepID=UPI003D73AC75
MTQLHVLPAAVPVVLGPLPSGPRAVPGVGEPPEEQTEFVGRAAERGRIAAALAAARAGRGGAIFVTGEPGAGRTRLAAEALAAAGPGVATTSGRASTVGSVVPYRPLVEALLSLARAGLLPGQEELGCYARVLTRLLTGAPGAGSPLAVAEAVLRLVAVVGRRRGALLLALDDLHDADPGTLTVVEYLLDHLGRLPAVVLLTARSEPCVAAELAARARQRGTAVVLDLAPLDLDEVRRLVATVRRIPPCEVDAEVVHRVRQYSGGIPFVAVELLRQPGGGGERLLRSHPQHHHRPAVPGAVAHSIRCRTARLTPLGTELLNAAALCGPRFPLPVLHRALGCTDAELTAVVRAATAAHLIVPDADDPRWYAFRHPLVGHALLADLGPVGRAAPARRVAAALVALHPELPGGWGVLAADLHAQAGDTAQAVRLYCAAAERSVRANGGAGAEGGAGADHGTAGEGTGLGDGTADGRTTGVGGAVVLLDRAHRLAGPETPPELRTTVLARLLDAAAWSARFQPVAALLTGEEAPSEDLPAASRAVLHARLAELSLLTGRLATAERHLDTAHWLLGDEPADADTAVVDLAAAHAQLHRPAPERLRTAAERAERARAAALRAERPALACRALLLLARLAEDYAESAARARLEEARTLALAHHLPVLRLAAEAELARLAADRDGCLSPLEDAHREAVRRGVLPLALHLCLAMALERIRRGEFETAGEKIRAATAEAERLGLVGTLAELRLAEAVRLAHQGRRAEAESALERLESVADAAPGLRPVAYGLARAFCSLLEERPGDAERELAQALALDAENPSTADFGRHGLAVLLGVLAGRLGRQHLPGTAGAGGTRWNRQFAGLAHAVLLGREGRTGAATAAAATALEAATAHPVARHLAVRLVAPAAHRDGWGTPVEWLREAEEYFHGAGLRAPAGACRALLRGMGATVRQRRTGTERVPPALRRCGVTAREFEVAQLLAERVANKDIAALLHISPRTVEKHVASLLQKTGHPDRTSFATAVRATPALFEGTGAGTGGGMGADLGVGMAVGVGVGIGTETGRGTGTGRGMGIGRARLTPTSPAFPSVGTAGRASG